MKKYLGSITLVLALFGSISAHAQTKVLKEVPAKMIPSLEGKDLFREYCAVCHGVEGKGGGPAASALKKQPGDLTQLSRANSGAFPALRVQMSIKGNGAIEHGTPDMPMWGSIFSNTGLQRDLGDMRIMALLKYVEQIQVK